MPSLSPGQFGQTRESKDSKTGHRHIYHDVNVPDRQGSEPSAVRAKAQEISPNKWAVQVVHGPHAEKDPSGSYYKTTESLTHEGPAGSVKSLVKKRAEGDWKKIMKERGN